VGESVTEHNVVSNLDRLFGAAKKAGITVPLGSHLKSPGSLQVVGPQVNDLPLQLRKQRVDQIILVGMLANMCVESHLRDWVSKLVSCVML
jgi:hypothetical protein